MKQKRLLIFDFDGTIADTKTIYYRAMSKQLKVIGYSNKNIDRAINIGLSLRKTLRFLGLSSFASWIFKKRIMSNIKEHINDAKKCKDVDSIKKIKEKNAKTKIILVTNSLKEFATPVLKHLKLKKYFKEVYGAEDFTGKSDFLKQYVKKSKIDKNNCYYIGDRVADIKIAKSAGCKSIIIFGRCAWDSKKQIIEQKPDFLIHSLKDIQNILD